jgi:arsenical pump membrane protein
VADVVDQLQSIAPALAFLLAGVPLAALLDRLGFFDAIATALGRRYAHIPVLALWILAALTTVVLNLDTTVVLLTPLYVRLARRAGIDPMPLATIPLVLASLASSVLPVSNLTTLIAVDQLGLTVRDVMTHLALPSAVACVVGWLVYRSRFATTIASPEAGDPDRAALRFGGAVVAALLVAFVVGPAWGVAPWIAVVAADVVLAVRTGFVPWRRLPVATTLVVLVIATAVLIAVPGDALADLLGSDRPVALVASAVTAAAAANVVNNLPTVLVAVDSVTSMTWGTWAWLLGANTGAVLLPMGALANLLWWRIARAEGLTVSLERHVRTVLPIAVPALAAAIAVLLVEYAWFA